MNYTEYLLDKEERKGKQTIVTPLTNLAEGTIISGTFDTNVSEAIVNQTDTKGKVKNVKVQTLEAKIEPFEYDNKTKVFYRTFVTGVDNNGKERTSYPKGITEDDEKILQSAELLALDYKFQSVKGAKRNFLVTME